MARAPNSVTDQSALQESCPQRSREIASLRGASVGGPRSIHRQRFVKSHRIGAPFGKGGVSCVDEYKNNLAARKTPHHSRSYRATRNACGRRGVLPVLLHVGGVFLDSTGARHSRNVAERRGGPERGRESVALH